MTLKVIAYARNGHSDKFGIPRQSREESPILTRIVFEPEYSVPEALRGIEGYSHLWLLWGFSRSSSSHTSSSAAWQEVLGDARSPQKSKIFGDPNKMDWSPTVRPPRLGGNKRMGVFATRSPFRPNPIGMSSVRNLTPSSSAGVYIGESGRPELVVSGADLLDGTPIYDIKPYLSYSDCHPEAQNGFAEDTKDYRLDVDWNEAGESIAADAKLKEDLTYILSQDPRPAYQDDPTREYKLDYAGYTVTFTVDGSTAHVRGLKALRR